MISKIIISSNNAIGELVDGPLFNANNCKFKQKDDELQLLLINDSIISIPPGEYELLSITSNCGEFVIDLPDCSFEEIKLVINWGNIKLNTNYNKLTFDTCSGKFTNFITSDDNEEENLERMSDIL